MMTNNQIANMLIILLGIMIFILILLICVFIFLKMRAKTKSEAKLDNKPSDKSKVQQLYNVQSIFNFMEFDKIEDNMIIQKKGKKFLMIIKCQGINYDLMSGVEKNSVEQGFIQYLNTLRYPIQIYIQTRTVDLSSSLNAYKQKIRDIGDNLAHKEFDYNQKLRNGKYEAKELEAERFEIVKSRNLYEYGTDIVNNTERMSQNRNILTKQYYIVLSYYPEEASNNVYSEEEISNIAFSELYTRAQSTINLISVCGVNGKILDSVELADLLYTAYNRDESEIYDLNKAISSGYDSLYITAPDILEKKMKELDKQIEIDAIQKANEAIYEIKQEREMEKKIKEKEKEYDDIVSKMAAIILEENESALGSDIVEEAKEKVKQSTGKGKERNKEEKVNGQEKTKKAGRPRKTA